MSAKIEREIKLPFASPDAARQAVARVGASMLAPRRLQRDALLDTTDRLLQNAKSALRIRCDGDRAFLTFKGPPQASLMKVREELETVAGDASVLLAIFERLGYRTSFQYEKYREEYRKDDVVIAVDETPMGTFVELEGGEPGIERIAHAMGMTPSSYVLDSYRALFVRQCQAQGVPVTDMLFTRA